MRSKMPAYSRQAVGNLCCGTQIILAGSARRFYIVYLDTEAKKPPMAAIQPVMAFLNRALENSKEK